MSFSPETGASGTVSPYEFMPDICRNLDGQFLNERESIKEENMCIYARIRPMLPQEEAKGFKECIAAIDEKTVRIVVPVTSAKYKNSRQSKEIVEDYSFDSAFGPESGQFVFFQETMLTSVQNFVDGRNSLIFSYGITGSGKTYTLQGNSENPGIIPLSLRLYFAAVKKQLLQEIKVKPHMYNKIIALSAAEQKQESYAKRELLSLYDEECDVVPGSFRNSNSKTFAMTLCNLFSDDYEAEERQTTLGPEDMASAQAASVMKEVIRNAAENQQGVCSVWVSFVEIYNENIFDLLQPYINERKRLILREDNGNVYIEGAREICVSDGDEALKILNIGRKQLSIASTKMNYQSSRSHCIYTIRVVRIPDVNNLSYGRVNRLSFCDLAGSERVAKTQTTGVRLKEAGAINTSLMVLGRCLDQLRLNQSGRDKRMIPFRDSKLTRLISGFFMGQGKAVMIANASPCDYTFDETLHVLKFTAVARKLLVNDTFFSDANLTLQSICNQWSNISNSSINESMESIESDSDIIQKKDEIIEKLIHLAENLTKKEQEMANMEMKIRQEVCLEYSEYSDQLLEEKRIMYEQLMEEMRVRYEKRIEKLTNMYEDIIKGLQEQLNETINSSEDTINDSKSFVDLEDLSGKSPVKRLSFAANIAELRETIQSQNTELEALHSTLTSLTTELEQTRQKQVESQNSIINLDKELNIYKAEKVKLSNECENYQSAVSKAMKAAKESEVNVKVLEEQISSLQKELSASKELCLMKEFNFHEIESEKEILENEVDTKKKEIDELKDKIEGYDADANELKTEISVLEDQLLNSEKNYAFAKEQLEIKIGSSSEIEKENIELRKEGKTLKEQIRQLKDAVEKYGLNAGNFQNKICNLESKLLSSEKRYEEQLQAKLNTASEFEKGIDKLKEENERLESKVKELNDSKEQYKECIENYKSNNGILENRLLSINKDYDKVREQLQNHCNRASELEKENEMLKNNADALKEEIKSLKAVRDDYDLDYQNLRAKINILEEKLVCVEEAYAEAKEQLQRNEVLKNNVDAMKEEIKSLKAVRDNYDLDNQNLRAKINSLEDKLMCVEKDYAEAKEQLQRNEVLKNNVDAMKEEIKSLKAVRDNYDLDNQNLRVKINSLEGNEVLKNNVDALKEEITNLEVNDYDVDNHNLKAEINVLEDKLLYSEKNYTEAKEQLKFTDKLKEDNENLESEVKELKDSKAQYEECIANYKTNIGILEDRLLSINKDYEKAREELQNHCNRASELEKEIEVYKDEIAFLRKHSSEASKKIMDENKLKEQHHEQDISFLKNKLSRTNEELENIFLYSEKFLSEIGTKIKPENNITKVLRNSEEFSYSQAYQSITEQLKDKIFTLLQELQVANKNADLITKEMKVREAVSVELEKEIDVYKQEIEALKQKSENVELLEKLSLKNQELEATKDCYIQMSAKHSELESRNNSYESEIESLKQQQETKEMELTEKLVLANKELKTLKGEIKQKSSLLLVSENQISTYKHDIKKMMESQKIIEEEKQDLMFIISTNEEKIEDLEDKLAAVDKELKTAKGVMAKSLVVEELQNDLEKHTLLLEILEKCEAKATEKIKELHTTVAKLKSEVVDLYRQIRDKESSIDELEKALCESQEQLKDFQVSCNQKLASEKEQHEIEIEQTMKLKHLVEEENMNLKKHNSKLNCVEKSISKKENPPKKNVSNKGKENLPKNTSTRSLRKKIVDLKEISFSSTKSSTSDINKRKARKRVSDEDFEPGVERVSKKMKSSEASKIPIKRTAKRKLQNDQETLSPVQKLTNTISSKMKVMSNNISSQISSPRLTRGMKKLFNTEAPSSSRSEKVMRGKK